jgi:hypothetical protein
LQHESWRRDLKNQNPLLQDALGLGWFIAVNLGVFIGSGVWLDKRFRTGLLFTLIGIALAFISCGYQVYKIYKKTIED